MKKAWQLITQKEIKGKPMSEMQPLEVCIIDDPNSDLDGNFVMRTQSEMRFEVMDLCDLRAGYGFTNKDSATLNVIPFEGDSITIKLK